MLHRTTSSIKKWKMHIPLLWWRPLEGETIF